MEFFYVGVGGNYEYCIYFSITFSKTESSILLITSTNILLKIEREEKKFSIKFNFENT